MKRKLYNRDTKVELLKFIKEKLMKKILFSLLIGIILISMVSSVGAAGQDYSPSYQDSEPPATEPPATEPAATEPAATEPASTEAPAEPTERESPNTCLRAYNYIENTLYNQDSGYTILRNQPWCRVWIFLKYGKWIQVPAEQSSN
jgi:hypothetical protein